MSSVIKNIINSLNKIPKVAKYLLLITLFFSSTSVCFVSGIFNYDTQFEITANQMTSIVESETYDGSFASVVVTSKNGDSSLPGEYGEYNYWKYIFRHSDFGYLSTVNAEKKYDICFSEINNDKPITFICSNVNTCYQYKNRGFKHELYDLYFMFEGNRNIPSEAINFCAISKSTADTILEKRGYQNEDGNYSTSDYQSLLGTSTSIRFDDKNYYFSIFNIYIEKYELYQNSKTVFDEFVLSFTKFPEGYNREATYIFNTYNYQNYHKLKRMNQLFSDGDYEINISKTNFKNSLFDIQPSLFNVVFNKTGNSVGAILFIILSALLYTFSFFILYYVKFEPQKWMSLMFSLLSMLFPYILFLFLFNFGGFVSTFSYFSLKCFALVIVFTFVFLFVYIRRLRRLYGKSN